MTSRKELAAQLEAEFARLGGRLKPGAAKQMIDLRITEVSAAMRIQPASALRYFDETTVRGIAQRSMQALNEAEAHEDALPDQMLLVSEIALAAPVFTICARLGIVNGDPDVAGGSVRGIVGVDVGVAAGHEPVWVQPAVILNGLRWCWRVTEQLAEGAWQVNTGGHSAVDEDAEGLLCARLRADLEAIAALAPPGSVLPPDLRGFTEP